MSQVSGFISVANKSCFLKSDRGTEKDTEEPTMTASACLLLYASVRTEMPCEL